MEIAPRDVRPARVLRAGGRSRADGPGTVVGTLFDPLLGTLVGTVLATALLAASALTVAAPAAAAPATSSDYGNGTYLVLLAQAPAASYRGGVRGLEATAPVDRSRAGSGYDATTPASRSYTSALLSRQDRIAASVDARPFYHYTVSLNGFAAALTATQARALASHPAVLAVVPDQARGTQVTAAPATGATAVAPVGGGGPRSSTVRGGAGVVIGVVDTGIDSDSRSFAPLGPQVPATYTGECQPGTDTHPAATFACSTKIVGGSYFVRGQGAQTVGPDEYLSPEDVQGHGTRVASAAAGNTLRRTVVRGVDLGRVSGAAPAARLASYKVCWAVDDGTASCLTSDILAGIDRAVADGVDVLSLAIADTTAGTDAAADAAAADPVELALMHAADAGVFVATAAGNGGPRRSSVGRQSPWTTTVGAVAATRRTATVVLGDGERFVGASVTAADVASAPLVLGRAAATVGTDRRDAAWCLRGSLDPAVVRGAVVVCDRGATDRVQKSAEVAAAGGVGMLLLNAGPGSLDADLHAVPTVHLPDTAYDAIHAYAAGVDEPTATIRPDTARLGTPPPALAPFSGRGPARTAGGEVLKPDLVAPGVDVLTAAPTAGGFALSSGTSVAAGHVAGLAARLAQAHPHWSPMAVKSALMTTARGLTDTTAPFGQGAGLARLQRALDPGLVFDSGLPDWESYLTGQGQRSWSAAEPTRATNANLASVVITDLAGRETVRRTVTNVSATRSTYSVSESGVEGVSVTAVPSVFTLAPGEQQPLTLRFVRDSAPLGTYETGMIRLNDGPGDHVLRLPVAVRPVGVRAPAQVRLGERAGAVSTRSGILGTLTARVRGPVRGEVTAADGSDAGGADFEAGMAGVWSQTVDVAGPGEWLRVRAVAGHTGDDLDLFLLDSDGTVVASAVGEAASESLTVHGLAAGTYTIDVQPWFVADPSGHTTFIVRTFQVPPRPTGSLVVEPRRQGASPGVDNTWGLSVRQRSPGAAWFGWIGWYAGDELVGRTVVSSR